MVIKRDFLPWSAADVADMTQHYAAEWREPLIEVARYIEARQHSSPEALIKLLTTDKAPDWTTITRIFTGKYENPEAFIKTRVVPALKIVRSDTTGYVPLPVSQKIQELLTMWAQMNTMAEIVGGAGRSKTFSCYDWHLDNPYSIYVDCPAVGGTGAFLREIASQMGISQSGTLDVLASNIEAKLDKRNILFIDEVARILPASANPHSSGAKALNFLQRLHDQQGVTVIFVATDIFEQTIADHRLEKYMAQLNRRIKYRYVIPAVSREEVAMICRAFDPDAGIDLARAAYDVATGPMGIGPLFEYLTNARLLADRRGDRLSVQHFREATIYSRQHTGIK